MMMTFSVPRGHPTLAKLRSNAKTLISLKSANTTTGKHLRARKRFMRGLRRPSPNILGERSIPTSIYLLTLTNDLFLRFGKAVETGQVTAYKPEWKEHIATFVFRYRPLGMYHSQIYTLLTTHILSQITSRHKELLPHDRHVYRLLPHLTKPNVKMIRQRGNEMEGT